MSVGNLSYIDTHHINVINILSERIWTTETFQGICYLHVQNIYIVGCGNKCLDMERTNYYSLVLIESP